MSSYFVASHAAENGQAAVHDRSRCPPGCFLPAATEYLGEFLDPAQAIAVARLRYPHVRGCACCCAGTATGVLAGSLRAAAAS